MQATADSLAFTPPREPAAVRGFLLAAIAHVLLIVALTWGISWDKDTTPAAVEAELWSALPQEAAPPPAPPPPPVQQQVVQPPVVAPPPPVVEKAPDINIEREKQRKLEEAKRQKDEERRKLEALKKKQLEEEARKEKAAKEQLAKEQAAKERAKQELDSRKREQQREQLRKEQIARMQAMASGSGSPSSQGTAAKSSGPSDSYAGRIRARVKPNIVFTDDVPGNPSTEVEVRMAPDGTIIARKINKASGVKTWDDAVLRALDKTEVLPRDVDGRVHTPLIIEFKLRG